MVDSVQVDSLAVFVVALVGSLYCCFPFLSILKQCMFIYSC